MVIFLVFLSSVLSFTIWCDHTVPWGHLFNSSAVNSAKQVLKRTISTASRNEIQKFLDIAIVKDFMMQKRKSLIRDGEITETIQTRGGEIGKHVKFEKTRWRCQFVVLSDPRSPVRASTDYSVKLPFKDHLAKNHHKMSG